MKQKLVPPDGGWAWAIAGAFTIFCFLVYSTLPILGLIFKTEFINLGFTGTESSLIFSTNGGVSMLCGLVNGALLNKFGTRAVSIGAGILYTGGLLMTAFATTFVEFMIYHGVVESIGIGMGMASYSVAINSYFLKRRNKVTGYALSVYGSGTILFPQLASYLLANYSVRDTLLLIGAISGNTLVAAMLVQPVEWHMKTETVPDEAIDSEEPCEEDKLCEEPSQEEGALGTVYNEISVIHASMTSLNALPTKFGSNYGLPKDVSSTEVPKKTGMLGAIVKMFDLKLLKDMVFVNILIGLSIEFIVEFNYLWIIPFVLIEGNLNVDQAATFMSIYAVADISFRFLAPYIASLFKQSNRVMYMVSLILVVSARSCLLFFTNYIVLLFVGAAIGAFRGMRLVYWSLVIPEHINIDKLASAFGISFTLNGVCMFIGAPILGALRDVSGNYKSCIAFLNCISLTTVTMWTLQIVYHKIKLRNSFQNKNISE